MITKNNIENEIENITSKFQIHKGKSSFYCFSIDIIPKIIFKTLLKFYDKNPNRNTLIVVDSYNTRMLILNHLRSYSDDFDTKYNIKVLSTTYISTKYKYDYDLIITVGLNDSIELIEHLNNNSKFMMTILTKNLMNNDFILQIRNILPNIDTNFNKDEINKAKIFSPVKEFRIASFLNNDDLELYNKYTEFINTSVKIFDNIENIEKCKNGDKNLNISAAEFRDSLARNNGWHEKLDVSIEFQKQIDDIYNPNVLFERACTFYNIVKQRRDLITDNISKLELKENICKTNCDIKILIVSKRGEFANTITKYLNRNNEEICGDYHDCIEECIATDCFNNVILIKSGANKGKPKVIGSQAISTRNEKYYNNDLLNILSIKNSSNKKLNINCDIIIFTSPICDNIFEFKSRFNKININTNPHIVYKIYCNNTIEENILIKEKPNKLIEIINENENFIQYDENSGNIIL